MKYCEYLECIPAFDEVMEVLKRYSDFEYVQMDDDFAIRCVREVGDCFEVASE